MSDVRKKGNEVHSTNMEHGNMVHVSVLTFSAKSLFLYFFRILIDPSFYFYVNDHINQSLSCLLMDIDYQMETHQPFH